MDNIILTQTQTEAELRKEVEIWYRSFIGRGYFAWVGFLVIAAGSAISFYRGSYKPASMLVAAAILFAVYILVLRRKLAINQVFNALKMSPVFGRETRIEITPGGTISIACAGHTGRHQLRDFARAVESPEALLLFVNKSGWISFSRKAFPSEKAYDGLLHNIELNGIRLERCKK